MTTKLKDHMPGVQSFDGVAGNSPQADDDIRQYVPLDTTTPDIRQSGAGTLFTCFRMFLLKIRAGLVPWGYRSAPSIGQLGHLWLNAKYAGLSDSRANELVSAQVRETVEDILSWAERSAKLETADKIIKQVERDQAMALACASIHWGKHPLDTERFRAVAIEQDYRLKVPGVAAHIAGRLDVVLEVHDDVLERSGYVILDHKFVSDPASYALAAGFGLQPRLYRLLASAALTDKPVLGFMHNVIQKPSCNIKDWQTFDEFLEECRDWYDAADDETGTQDEAGYAVRFKSGPRKGQVKPRWEWAKNADGFLKNPPMCQFLTRYTEPLLPDELYKQLQIVSRACGCQPTLSNFGPTGEAAGVCRNHWNKPCPYLPLCSNDPDNWEAIIQDGFRPADADQNATEPDELVMRSADG
jgi:hypothetical protein